MYTDSIFFFVGATIDYVDTEEQLFALLIEKIRRFDPDILAGYEVQNSSWGYLVERGAELGKYDMKCVYDNKYLYVQKKRFSIIRSVIKSFYFVR